MVRSAATSKAWQDSSGFFVGMDPDGGERGLELGFRV